MNYEELIAKLVQGELDKIEVAHDDFMSFREAWLKREDRKYIVGEAAHKGDVTYRYDPSVI